MSGQPIETVENEEWREIDGYEGRYEVSNMGRVRSLTFRRWFGERDRKEPLILKQGGDFPHVMLSLDGVREYRSVSVLVAEAFIGPKPKGGWIICGHLNGNDKDNRVSNLAWLTGEEMDAVKLKNGTKPMGETHQNRTMSRKEVEEIKRADVYYGSGVELSKKYGVPPTHISYLRKGKAWGHVK